MMFGRFRKNSECGRARDMLSEYVDGRLVSGERERLEAHLVECPECREELDSLRSTVAFLHRLPVVAVPCSFRVAVPRLVPRPALFGALRFATAVATVFMAFFFTADVTNLFQESAPAQVYQQETATPQATPLTGLGELLAGPSEGLENPIPSENIIEELSPGTSPEVGWFMMAEVAFAGLVIILGGLTLSIWYRWKRKVA